MYIRLGLGLKIKYQQQYKIFNVYVGNKRNIPIIYSMFRLVGQILRVSTPTNRVLTGHIRINLTPDKVELVLGFYSKKDFLKSNKLLLCQVMEKVFNRQINLRLARLIRPILCAVAAAKYLGHVSR